METEIFGTSDDGENNADNKFRVSRRTVVQASAWAAPTLAVVSAAPAAAASAGTLPNYVMTFTSPTINLPAFVSSPGWRSNPAPEEANWRATSLNAPLIATVLDESGDPVVGYTFRIVSVIPAPYNPAVEVGTSMVLFKSGNSTTQHSPEVTTDVNGQAIFDASWFTPGWSLGQVALEFPPGSEPFALFTWGDYEARVTTIPAVVA